MPQFDVVGIVEALNCRLMPYADFDQAIPEPDDKQIGQFLADLKRVLRESREKLATRAEVDVTDAAQVAKAIEELEPAEFERSAGVMAEIYSALCSGTPTKEQILAVPPRYRTPFYAWLQKEVLNPEVAGGGGGAQVTRLPSRAAG